MKTEVLHEELATIVLLLGQTAQGTSTLHFQGIQSTISVDIQADEKGFHPGAVDTHGFVGRIGLSPDSSTL